MDIRNKYLLKVPTIILLVGVIICIRTLAFSEENLAYSEEELRNIVREKELKNQKRHQALVDAGIVETDREGLSVGTALHRYQYDDDPDALDLFKKILDPDSDEASYALAVINQIKLDANTVPILYDFAANSSSGYRSLALARLDESPRIDGVKQADLLRIEKLFDDIDHGIIKESPTYRIKANGAYQRFKANLDNRSLSQPSVTDRSSIDNVAASEIIEQHTIENQSDHSESSPNQTSFYPIQEPEEQSFAWWFWLFGAVVLVGGLSLWLRFKK
jgi:hypothetical protein